MISDGDSPIKKPELSVRVFDGIGIDVNNEPLSIGGPRQQRLLALLTIRAGAVCDIDWIAEYLWTDGARPDDTEGSIRVSVSRLRRALPDGTDDLVETAPGGYRISASPQAFEHLRVGALRDAATAARDRQDPLAAQALLADALSLWRGAPFIELQDLDWAQVEIERLRQDRLEMIEERFEVELDLGRHTQITGDLAAFTAENALRERSWRQYALALHRSGRQADALNALQQYRTLLGELSGLDPSAAIAELEAKLLASDPSLLANPSGRPLRGYQLIEQIGSGAFSIVWRGTQPSVNRDVAIKQIRAELASQPEFIRRFEAEAQLVARIEHPHIIPLIDYWRDPDSAYLVMRWLRGGTLERSLDDGAWSIDRTLSMAKQIGDALAEAHAAGIVHRDVKAANILLDESGNAFLGDFGIALEAVESAGPAASLSSGSPAYASPEQLRREPLGPQADIFSLGVVIYECLIGSLPFPEVTTAVEMVRRQLNDAYPLITQLRPDVPASVAAAVDRATAKNPAERFDTVQEFLNVLLGERSSMPSTGNASVDARHTTLQGDITNPYKGLRPFDHGDADDFFGRDRLVSELLGQLAGDDTSSRCVSVVGPSGSGKSSLVRAGLIPALRSGQLAGANRWYISTMTPGGEPFDALEAALLRIAVNPPTSLLDELVDGPRGVLRSLHRCLPDDDDRVLLVIDQFEELFIGSAPETVDAFLNALAVAVEDPTTPLRVVLTLRADFYDRPLAHPAFARILKAGAVDVTPLAADELEEAIVGPANRGGVGFEAGLVARLAAEALGQPAPLPMLQYTLSELFDRRAANVMTLECYDEIGGLTGALAVRAEALFMQSNVAEQAACRRLFGRLTNPGAEHTDLRRRALLVDLGDDAATAAVLDRFGQARLLSFDRDVTSREPTVEVAHEALLREWPRLTDWLDQDRDLLRTAQLLATATDTWEGGGRQTSDLHRGGRLDTALGLLESAPDRLRPVDHDFVAVSQTAANAEAAVERTRVTRLRRLVGVVGVALVLALVAGGVAFRQQGRANDEAERAETAAAEAQSQAQDAERAREEAEAATAEAELATLISRSAALSADQPSVAVLLALEANRREPGRQTEQAVLSALTSIGNQVATFPPSVPDGTPCDTDGAVALDGLAQYATIGGTMIRQDLVTGQLIEVGRFPGECGYWSADLAEQRKIAADFDGSRAWFGPYGSTEWDVELSFVAPTDVAAFSPAGPPRVLVRAGSSQAGARMWLLNTETGDPVGDTIGSLIKPASAFSADGNLVAISSGTPEAPDGAGPVVVLDATTGEALLTTETSSRAISFHFDLEQQELILGTTSGRVLTIDLQSGAVIAEVETSVQQDVSWLGLQSNGTVVAGSRGLVELLDREQGPISGSAIELRNVAIGVVRPDGNILIHKEDHTNEVIDLDGNPLTEQSIRTGPLNRAEFGFGQAVMLDIGSGEAEVVDLATGERNDVTLIEPDGNRFVALAVVPRMDGFLAFGSDLRIARFRDGTMTDLLEVATRDGVVIGGGDGFPGRVALLGDRRVNGQEVHLIDTTDGNLRVMLTIETSNAQAVYPSANDGLHVFHQGGELVTYDAAGEITDELDVGIDTAEWAAGDGTGQIAFGGAAGAVIIDTAFNTLDILNNVGHVSSLGFIRHGELLVLGSRDGTVRLWDVERARYAGEIWDGNGTALGSPWYDETSDSVWVATSGIAVRLPLSPERWVERACELVGRNLSQAEWAEYVPGDHELQPTCANF